MEWLNIQVAVNGWRVRLNGNKYAVNMMHSTSSSVMRQTSRSSRVVSYADSRTEQYSRCITAFIWMNRHNGDDTGDAIVKSQCVWKALPIIRQCTFNVRQRIAHTGSHSRSRSFFIFVHVVMYGNAAGCQCTWATWVMTSWPELNLRMSINIHCMFIVLIAVN